MPEFRCDLAQTGIPLEPVWAHTVGSGHAPLALRADWQAQLRRCREDLGIRHVRFHGLLDDAMSTFVVHGGEPVYSFFNADQIWDFLLSIGMRPFVELSFMPKALASGSGTVFHYRGNITPPSDYAAWGDLVERLARHAVDRYGAGEVRRWFFEVWNEPNLAAFWSGSQADYFRLYRHAAEAIKRVDPDLRVGGPATANEEWIEDLLDFCEREDLPADFVSTHTYPTDAFGQPGDDTERQLAQSRRGILRERAQDTARRARGKPVYYTEWNASSNPAFHLHDRPYAAAFVMKTYLEVADSVDGYSFWTFSDLFEELYFRSAPFHGGFGLLTIHGIAKPVYRAVELLGRAGGEQLLVDGGHATVDRWVTRTDDGLVVFLTNHAMPGRAIEAERVRLVLHGAFEPSEAVVERIDEDHANARKLWEAMGEPGYLQPDEVEALHQASELVREPVRGTLEGDVLTFELDVPAHAVTVLTLRR